jgi:hypothetical protein
MGIVRLLNGLQYILGLGELPILLQWKTRRLAADQTQMTAPQTTRSCPFWRGRVSWARGLHGKGQTSL